MSLLTKVSPSLSTRLPSDEHAISGLLAGEDIAIGDACYIKSDGLIWRSNGTTLNAAAAKVDGFAARAALSGQPVTLYHGVNFNYGSGLTPGARYYAGATAGRLDTAATTGGTGAVAKAIDATRIFVWASNY
jgi:hypothetical protein